MNNRKGSAPRIMETSARPSVDMGAAVGVTYRLGMRDTFLFDHDASPSQRARLAGGYSTPTVARAKLP